MQQAHDYNKRKPARNSFLVEFLVWSSPFVLSIVWFDHQVSKDIDALIHHCAVPAAAADNAPAESKRSAVAVGKLAPHAAAALFSLPDGKHGDNLQLLGGV